MPLLFRSEQTKLCPNNWLWNNYSMKQPTMEQLFIALNHAADLDEGGEIDL